MTVLTKNWPPLLVILLSLAAGHLSLPYLPATLPVHWGLDGSISSYSSKVPGVYLNPGGMIVAYLFFSMIPYTDKRRVRELRGIGIYEPLRNTAVFTFGYTQLLVIGIGLGILNKNASYLVGQGALLLLLGSHALRSGIAEGIRQHLPYLAGLPDSGVRRVTGRLGVAAVIGSVGACSGFYPILWLLVPCSVVSLLELRRPNSG